jgi:hypothetical protein
MRGQPAPAQTGRKLAVRNRNNFVMAATNIIPVAPSAAQVSTNALRDIKPPVEIPAGWLWVMWMGGALLLAALGYWGWRYWKKRQVQMAIPPVIPAHMRAKQRLEEALRLLAQPREFCIIVSDTIRYYLEERFTFRAPERTTEEFLYELRKTNLLTPDQKESLGEFLKRCDLVKFARYEPGEPELRALHSSALRLVEETEPVSETVIPEEVGGGRVTHHVGK